MGASDVGRSEGGLVGCEEGAAVGACVGACVGFKDATEGIMRLCVGASDDGTTVEGAEEFFEELGDLVVVRVGAAVGDTVVGIEVGTVEVGEVVVGEMVTGDNVGDNVVGDVVVGEAVVGLVVVGESVGEAELLDIFAAVVGAVEFVKRLGAAVGECDIPEDEGAEVVFVVGAVELDAGEGASEGAAEGGVELTKDVGERVGVVVKGVAVGASDSM